jgi:hypothetical protein
MSGRDFLHEIPYLVDKRMSGREFLHETFDLVEKQNDQ